MAPPVDARPSLAVAVVFCALASWLTYVVIMIAVFSGSASVPLIGGAALPSAKGVVLACWAWLVAQLLVCASDQEISGFSFIVRVVERFWFAGTLALGALTLLQLVPLGSGPPLSPAWSVRAASILFDLALTGLTLASR